MGYMKQEIMNMYIYVYVITKIAKIYDVYIITLLIMGVESKGLL